MVFRLISVDKQSCLLFLVARLIFAGHQYKFLYEHECFVQPRQIIREETVIEANESCATTTWMDCTPHIQPRWIVFLTFVAANDFTPHLAWVTHLPYGRTLSCQQVGKDGGGRGCLEKHNVYVDHSHISVIKILINVYG